MASATMRRARWLPGALAAAATLTAAVWALRHDWPTPLHLALVRHVGAAATVSWVFLAWLLRLTRRADRPDAVAGSVATGLERVALMFSVPVVVGVVFEMTVAALLRTGLPAVGRPFATSANGLIDLIALAVAVCLSPTARRQVTPLFWLMVATVGWSALMTPVWLSSKHVVTDWPRWMPWMLWCVIGLSLVLFGFVVTQGMLRQHRRKRAWPDHLEWLTDGHADWPGFRPSVAAVAMVLLPLGAYHADSFFVMPCAVMAGGAALRLAHRQWQTNFAEVGLALITLAVVSFFVACVPDSWGGGELTTRMPLLLIAAMIGLAVMVFMWQWLPSVWDQQLQDGRAWTTTGWMIPLTRRIGVIVAAFGVLAAMQLALWPELASMRDDSVLRWMGGLLGNVLLVGAMIVGTLFSRRKSLAALTLLSLAMAGVYVIVRFPDNVIKFRLTENWPVALALVAPICLTASRWTRRERWQPFAGLLEGAALAAFPAVAIAGTITVSLEPVASLLGKLIHYDVTWVRTATWSVLAVHYALCAHALERWAIGIAAGILAVLVAVNVGLSVVG